PPYQGAATLAASVVASTGGRAGRWRSPLAGVPWAAAPVEGLGHSQSPLQGGWPWPATPVGGLAVVGRPCKGPGHGRSPTSRTAFGVKTQQECIK
ncbi:hypothetical protein BHM03_00046959, partial [Ensete ventricosum]